MSFADGERRSKLERRRQGRQDATPARRCASGPIRSSSTRPKFSLPRLKHVLRAKAVLCPGLRSRFTDETSRARSEEWFYEDGLRDYLTSSSAGTATACPSCRSSAQFKGERDAVDWAVVWLPRRRRGWSPRAT